MNESCEIIRDLLPLYHDGVCSEASKTIVTEHLVVCEACQAYYETMCQTSSPDILVVEHEKQKAASFRAVRKKLRLKQTLSVIAAVVIVLALAVAVMSVAKQNVHVLEDASKVTVLMKDDGSLVARLQGGGGQAMHVKRIETTAGETYLFFRLSTSQWDDWTADDKLSAEFALCFADRGADEVDAVYYYPGDYEGLEMLSSEELQKVIEASKRLWHK